MASSHHPQRLHDAPGSRDPHMSQRSQRMHDTQAQAQELLASTIALSETELQANLPHSMVERDHQHLNTSQAQSGVVAPTASRRHVPSPLTRTEALEELERRRASPKRPPEDNRASLTAWAHRSPNRRSEPYEKSNYQSQHDNDPRTGRKEKRSVHEKVREDYKTEQEAIVHQNSLRDHFYDDSGKATKKWNHSDWYDRGEVSPARTAPAIGKPRGVDEGVVDPQHRLSPIQRHEGKHGRRPTVGSPMGSSATPSKLASVNIGASPTSARKERSASPVASAHLSSYHADRYNVHTPAGSLGAGVVLAKPHTPRPGTVEALGGGESHLSPLDSIMQERGNLGECQGCQLLKTEVRSLQQALRTVQNQVSSLVHWQRSQTGSAGLDRDMTPMQEFPESERVLTSRRTRKVQPSPASDSEFSTTEVKDENLKEYIEELNKAKKLRRESKGLGGFEGSDGEDDDLAIAAAAAAPNSNRIDNRVSSSRDAVLRREMQGFEKRLLKAMVQLANRVSTLEGDSLRLLDDAGQLKKDQSALFEAVVLKSEMKQRVLQVMETSKSSSDEQVSNLYDLFHLEPSGVQTAVSSRSSQQCLDVVLNSPAFKGLFDMGMKSARQLAEVREQLELSATDRQARATALGPNQQFMGLELREENDLQGLKVYDVMIGSPSQAAGLQAGDRINRVNNTPVMTIRDYVAAMANVLPNTHVKVQRVPAGRNQFPETVDVLATNHTFMTAGSAAAISAGLGPGGSGTSPFTATRGPITPQASTSTMTRLSQAFSGSPPTGVASSLGGGGLGESPVSGFSSSGFDYDGGSSIPLPPSRR